MFIEILRNLMGQGEDQRGPRSHREQVRKEATFKAREALQMAGSSRMLRELDAADAQYRIRVRARGK